MDQPSLTQQIEAVEFIAAQGKGSAYTWPRIQALRAAAATLRKVQSGEYVLEDELLQCDAPAPGAADSAEREGR